MSSNGVSNPSAVLPRLRIKQRRWVFAVLLVLAVFLLVWQVDWIPSQALYQQASAALQRGNYSESLRLGRRLMSRKSHQAEGTLFVAESNAHLGNFDEAFQLLQQVPADNTRLKLTAELMVARIQCDDLHKPALAEQSLRSALQLDPKSVPAHEKLAYILGLAGRSWEAESHRLALIAQDRFSLHHLSLLALGHTAAENPDLVDQFAKVSPEDPLVQCALARIAVRNGQIETGETLLDEVLRKHPALVAAHYWKGEILLNRRDQSGLATWESTLPAEADEYPEIWFVRGGNAAQQNEPRVAARCFWECVRRDPNHHTACYQLANVLTQLGENESAEPFRQRARLLGELIMAAKTMEITGSLESAQRAAEVCDALGLKTEAWGWRQIQQGSNSGFRWDPQRAAKPEFGASRVESGFDPSQRISLARFPLPTRTTRTSPSLVSTPAQGMSRGIAFVEEAKTMGIDFRFHNGSNPKTEGEFMFEFSGGGVASLDYDVDGWPDLYFTQGSDSPPYVSQDIQLDRLFRNGADGHFGDVTVASGIRETGFSQGCAVGDFDNDGFPDLYIGNIGANRFYHNNGDGTFTDVTQQTGTAGNHWTTSCVFADVNGDGNPDLFTVNYLTGKDLFTQACRMADGSPRICTPHEFPADQDQLFINLGDGRFEDQSSPSGIEVPEGKGLGIVAADFDGSGKTSLFVANDAVPNFYFRNVSTGGGGRAQFEEQGYLSGLAVDADGQPQACMGVAAGDANGDGLLDLYISNFRNESNTLYVQQTDGSFIDGTRPSGLREPSYAMLGFGTQFIDADLDGWLDLVLTNGHVGNLKHHGVAYEMPPQFFRNLGEGRFVELAAKDLGPFFAGEYLGRGLARVDWNRDGREDFAVSHLKSPAAVVTNQTAKPGNFLAIHLRGVESDRDAIGSQVMITVGGRKLVRQLTAGDGYHASNQRVLVFGLGDSQSVERLEIRWPSRRTQICSIPRVNTEVLVIEGRAEPVEFSPPRQH